MPRLDIAFDDVLLVMVVAVLVPVLLGLVPRLPDPDERAVEGM